MLFFSGSTGRNFWADDGDFPQPTHLLQRDLSTGDNDFRIVEVKWSDAWHHGDDENLIGPAKLACRVATIVEHIVDSANYYDDETGILCATGQSGGGNQLAYTLTHYGLGDLYDGVIFTSGPPYTDLELACGTSCDTGGIPDTSMGCFHSKARWQLDTAYGTPTEPLWTQECSPLPNGYDDDEECGDGEFPNALCVNHQHEGSPPANEEFADDLSADSIAVETSRWNYDYYDTKVFFIFGANDGGAAPFQGEIFFDVLDADTSNDVETPILVQGVGHQLHETAEGTAEIMQALAEACFATIPE